MNGIFSDLDIDKDPDLKWKTLESGKKIQIHLDRIHIIDSRNLKSTTRWRPSHLINNSGIVSGALVIH
jgi:hypothetical protein